MTAYIMRGFVGMDSTGNCFALSVFNISPEMLKVGDEIIVADPEVIDVKLEYKGVRQFLR